MLDTTTEELMEKTLMPEASNVQPGNGQVAGYVDTANSAELSEQRIRASPR